MATIFFVTIVKVGLNKKTIPNDLPFLNG